MEALRSIYQAMGRQDWTRARARCRDILAQGEDVAAVHHAIGLSFCGESAFADALPHLVRAWRLDPANPRWLRDLSAVYAQTGRWREAYDVLTPRLDIVDADALAVFLTAAVETGRAEEALALWAQRGLPLPSANLQCLCAYGLALAIARRHDEAETVLLECIARDPERADAHEGLAFVYEDLKEAERSMFHSRAHARLSPASAHAQMRLALVCSERGLVDEARSRRHQAEQLGITRAEDHSANLFMMLSDPRETGVSIGAAAQRAFANEEPLRPVTRRRAGRMTGRRLRVGYVSGECRTTPAYYFFRPFLPRHDRSSVEVFIYSMNPLRDHRTAEYKSWPEHWRDGAQLSRAELIATMRADDLDIVVDLSGHFIFNALWTLTDRVAPVHATYPNYPGTTGCPGIDYFFTDTWTSPPGTESEYSEQLYRLPCGYLMYAPADKLSAVVPLPMRAAGHPTFGIFQRLSKFNADVWDAVALVLTCVPSARLLLQNGDRELDRPDSETSRMIRGELHARDIDPGRVTLKGPLPHREHMKWVSQVDVALDTFPYNGQTTTCESLWMGVPVVTMRRGTHVGRVCAALLTRMGRPEWVATSLDAYADIAASLVADARSLARTRRQLRHEMIDGGLMDGDGLARALETAYQALCC